MSMYENSENENKESTPIELVEATIADVGVLIETEKSVAGTRTYSPMLEEEEWSEELTKSKVFLIKKDGAVVGNVSYEREGDERVYISGLVVKPKFQGKGVAKEVLKKLLDQFESVKKIDLVTHPENERALELYRSLGFVVSSVEENYFGDGEPRLKLERLSGKL